MEKSSFPVRNGLSHSQPAKLEWNVVKCETLWNNTPTNSNIAFPKYCYLPDISILIKKFFFRKINIYGKMSTVFCKFISTVVKANFCPANRMTRFCMKRNSGLK